MLTDITINIWASLIWVIITFMGSSVWKRSKYWWIYRGVGGKYANFTVEGEMQSHSSVKVQRVVGRGFRISCKTPDEDWESQIVMSEDLPMHGEGIYQHAGRDDWGVHRIQINKQKQLIYVYWTNKSSPKKSEGSYILKPIREEPSKTPAG